jgi:hypothetical protein
MAPNSEGAMFKGALCTAALLASLLIPAVARAAPRDAAASADTVALPGDAVIDATIDRLTRPLTAVELPPLPGDPVQALIDAVNVHSLSLGFRVDHSASIRNARLPVEFAGRLALLVQATLECRLATTKAQRLGCAVKTNDTAAGVIQAKTGRFPDVDLWPSVFIDGDGSDDFYVYDYSVLIDRGGNDVYDNNAGGNLQDVNFGPPGSVAPAEGPAIGCEQVQGNFPAPTAGAHDCIAAAQVVFIDDVAVGARSDDIYGVFKSPRMSDHNPPLLSGPRRVDGDCTFDRVVRRIVLQGSGFEGNGLLIDVGGNDKYNGKTAAQGSGHVGGVGILRDLGAGGDRYLTIRNSQGFSLVGDLGVLQDDGGDDRFDTYMPSPRDPSAAFQADGSGGVIDDTGVCDNLPRMVQGAALAGGFGALLDDNGRDVYIGAPPSIQQFSPDVQFFHSSQGFGCDGGEGMLRDTGRGDDTYAEGPVGRANGVTLTEASTTCSPALPGVGIFSDDGP